MKRRSIVCAAGGAMLAVALPVLAQATPKVYQVGVLTRGLPRANFALPAALRDLGYEEGRNIIFDYRSANGQSERLPGLAVELVNRKVDLIVGIANSDVEAAKRATSTIPILMMYGVVPVEMGIVASLARPGGNVTGTTLHGPETAAKILQLLRGTVPRLKRVSALADPEVPFLQPYIRASMTAAGAMGIEMSILPAGSLTELEASFSLISRDRPDALYVVDSSFLTAHRARLFELVAQLRLPAIYTAKAPVSEGGLMSYSNNADELVKRAAAITDRLLQGARPADIPIEQPTRFDFAINLKAARAIGLRVPQSILLQATEVIE